MIRFMAGRGESSHQTESNVIPGKVNGRVVVCNVILDERVIVKIVQAQ